MFSIFLWMGVYPVLAASMPAAKDREDQIKQIESELLREKQNYQAFDFKEKDLLERLSDLDQEVAEKKKGIEELKQKIHASGTEVESLEKMLQDVERGLKRAEERLKKRLVALYKYSRAGYMHILADAQDLDQFRQRVKYVWAVMREDRKVLGTLMEEGRKAHGEISRIRRKMTEAASRKDEENTRLAVLKKDLDEKVLLLMNVHREKEFYETAVRELELGAQDLKRTLSDIESKKSENIPKYSHFADLEGKLPLPLDGKPVRGGQFLKTPDLNLRKGVFIEAASDREVKAVFPGRVDFSGRLKGYGEMVVINHGERFFTISALLSQRTKKKGDRVKAGEAIGRVAGEGPSKEAVVYFEIRRRGENLDPMKWFKLP